MADLHRISSAVVIALALAVFGGVRPARAHIDIDAGGTHKARFPESGLKDGPCGVTGSKRGTNIFTYRPGTTINISLSESIPHPGYFRIAFDSDGDDGFETPSGTSGEMGSCSGDSKCGPGKEDYCNNDTVLLDKLDMHAGELTSLGKIWTWSVKLPDIECDNCTLQIIQVMNDLNVHASPYPGDDIYYQCIDIALKKDAPETPSVTPVPTNGMTCTSATGGTAGAGGAAAGAGGSAAGASGGAATAGGGGATAAAAGTGVGGAGAPAPTARAGAGGSPTSGAPIAGTSGAAGRAAGAAGASPSSAAGSVAPVATAGSGTITNANTGAGAAAPTPAPAADSGGCSAIAGQHGSQNAGPMFVALALGLLAASRLRRKLHKF